LSQRADHYVLVELADASPDAGLREKLEDVLGKAMDSGVVLDAALAGSSAERLALWQMRENFSEAQKRESAVIKNDVSVPVSQTPEFIAQATEACAREFPEIRIMAYGHLGDGNIHFHLFPAVGASNAEFLKLDHAIMDTVNEVVRHFDGSFSAEHGVGQLKAYMMEKWRGGVELDTMRRIKAALDPMGIMNPGKVLP
jgi:FAD/FMN-containing dehydrogenase